VNKARGTLVMLVGLMAAMAVVLAPSAGAQIVVGQVAPTVAGESFCEFTSPYDEFQLGVASGNSYVVPTAGVLTSWSINEGAAAGPVGLKVFRPVGPGLFLVVGHDGPRPLTPNSLNTFPVVVPVQAGDLVGISVVAFSPSNCAFNTGLEADVIGYREGSAADGATISQENSFNEQRLNVSATLLPPPTIASLSPTKGSIKGATVTVTGANFASVTGVSFGASAAKSFTVDSEGQITAVAPTSKTLAKVPVTVTTVAGTATSSQLFAYQGCKVPHLKGKKLKAAKKKLKKSGCKLGHIKKQGDATSKTGKVVKQGPKPGKILAPGTKVKVTLGT
jgi:hypothetical protein